MSRLLWTAAPVCAVIATSAAALDFKSGLDIDGARQKLGRYTAFGACPPAPPPAVDMSGFESRYQRNDPTQSKIDPERAARAQQQGDSFLVFTRSLGHLADKAIFAKPPNPAIHACIMSQLAVWARAGAATQKIEDNDRLGRHQAIMMQAWHGTGFASVIARIGGFAAVPGPDADVVKAWLRGLAASVKAEYSGAAGWLRPDNNHAYWAGFFTGMAGVVLEDAELVTFSCALRDQALDDVAADGSLPKELKRGAKALEYQYFATLAIAGSVVLCEASGKPADARREAALERLVTFGLDRFIDPAPLEQKLGVKLEPANRSHDIAWAEMLIPYYAVRNPGLAARLETVMTVPKLRPVWHFYLGGNVSAGYNPMAQRR
jgi:poly(beta-D-mannuronate) lyase